MEWLEVSIQTVSSAIELLAARLTAIGYDSFIIDDTADFQSFLETNTQYWDYVDEELAQRMAAVSQIRLYIAQDPDAPQKLRDLQNELLLFRNQNPNKDLGTLALKCDSLQDQDWENNWKQHYQPIPIGTRLLIVPQWLHPDNPDGRIPVVLDPGMIFGTGAHASTQMCLRTLEKTIRGGESVIDLGSGSGILSITALLLGAVKAVGVDIDPKAEDIARENAALNGLTAPRFTAVTGNVIGDNALMEQLSQAPYDVVLANIVADVIIPLAPVVPHFLKDGGSFICSGILNTRLPEVLQALEAAGLRVISQDEENDWCCLSAGLK